MPSANFRRSYPRPDPARTPTSLRPLSAELSPLSRPDGSASLRAGNTHVLCAVHGPASPRRSSRRADRPDAGCVSVAFSRGLVSGGVGGGGGGGGGGGASSAAGETNDDGPEKTSGAAMKMKTVPVPPPPGLGASERELESFLRDVLSSCILLERYPRCVIQVVVQIVQADGSALGCALNCAVLALLDAGVAMGGLPVASTCVVVPPPGPGAAGPDDDGNSLEGKGGELATTVWLDPTAEEEAGEGHSILVIATDAAASSSSGEIIASMTFGAPLSLKGMLAGMEGAGTSGAAIAAFMRLAVEQKVGREVQTLWS